MTAEKADRPDSLDSVTQRVETGRKKVYVTINHDGDGRPFEVFINTGQSGGLTNSWCEALGKAVSNGLRSGADAAEIADDLIGIRSGKVMEDNGDMVTSIPDAVGVALKRFLRGRVGEPVKDEGEVEPR